MRPGPFAHAVFMAGRIVARWAMGLPLGTYLLNTDGKLVVDEDALSDDERADPLRVRDDLVASFASRIAFHRFAARDVRVVDVGDVALEIVEVLARMRDVFDVDNAVVVMSGARRSALAFLDEPTVWPLLLTVAGLLVDRGAVHPRDLDTLLAATMPIRAVECGRTDRSCHALA